jgi:hypothetical protein
MRGRVKAAFHIFFHFIFLKSKKSPGGNFSTTRRYYHAYNERNLSKELDMRRYGFGKFILDCLLTFFTGGFWLIWVFVREMRRKNTPAW